MQNLRAHTLIFFPQKRIEMLFFLYLIVCLYHKVRFIWLKKKLHNDVKFYFKQLTLIPIKTTCAKKVIHIYWKHNTPTQLFHSTKHYGVAPKIFVFNMKTSSVKCNDLVVKNNLIKLFTHVFVIEEVWLKFTETINLLHFVSQKIIGNKFFMPWNTESIMFSCFLFAYNW